MEFDFARFVVSPIERNVNSALVDGKNLETTSDIRSELLVETSYHL